MNEPKGEYVEPDIIELTSIETVEAHRQGLRSLWAFLPVKLGLELTSIRGEKAIVSGWKIEDNELTLRIIFRGPHGNRIPENSVLNVDFGNDDPGSPERPSGQVYADLVQSGITECDFTYLLAKLKLSIEDLQKIEIFFEKYSHNKAIDISPSLKHFKSYKFLKRNKWLRENPLTPKTIAVIVAGVMLAAAAIRRNVQYNDKVQCDLMAEGRSLHEGDYRFPEPPMETLQEPNTAVEEFAGKTGITLEQRIVMCREAFGTIIPKEIAAESIRKTDETHQ